MTQVPNHYEAKIRDFSSRTSSGSYGLLDENEEQIYSAVRSLSRESGDHLIERGAVKARCKPFFDLDKTRMQLTDFCYGMINADDCPNKFLRRECRGRFYFVDFDWSCEEGEPITWYIDELKKKFTVGEYRNKKCRWNFNTVKLSIFRQELDQELLDITRSKDAGDRVLRLVARRQGQYQFRQELLKAYKGKCAISDCNVEEALEAAHIVPYYETQANVTSNGLLLRADLHTLFDLNLVTVNPQTMRVLAAPDLLQSTYRDFHQKMIRLPESETDRPSKEALENHYSQCGWAAR
jgi:HNH endonuclease